MGDNMTNSIWHDTLMPKFPAQRGDLKTDVLVIGGGMAGLLCAYKLQNAGVDVTLVEQNRICGGVTQDTTAKITMQHGLVYHKLLEKLGKEKAKLYARAHQDAVTEYRNLSQRIDCHFADKHAFAYSVKDRQVLEAEAGALHRLGIPATVKDETALPFPVAGAVMVKNQAQFHPLEFAKGIADGLHIHEHTAVLHVEGHSILTNRGRIYADKIIVATHFPFINTHGSYFLKLYQHRSYVIALKNAADVDGMYIGTGQTKLSFRNSGDLLLLGGGGHRTGKKGGAWKELRAFAQKYYPEAEEVAHWATQDCISLDGMPYIGHYSKHTPNLYVATGFNKWGMTGSMVAANTLTNQILGCDDPHGDLFSPSRNILQKQLAVNAASSVGNFLHFTTRRCPHMGCALKWNKAERTWDCPCHGSRFSEDGKLLNNPATDDLPD